MLLNEHHAQSIVAAIAANNAFNRADYIPFHTDQTIGSLHRDLLNTVLDTGLFEYDYGQNILRFADRVNNFDRKTTALQIAILRLIEHGLIPPSREPHFQERAVGGDNRTIDPEFKINRAFFRIFGFMGDGVFLNALYKKDGQIYILLQIRGKKIEFGGKYDLPASGGVKFPQNIFQALQTQYLEETGARLTAKPILNARTAFAYTQSDKRWTTRLTHHLFVAELEEIKLGQYDPNEIQKFELLSVEEAILACAKDKFNEQNIQGFMTSLIACDLLPDFPGADKIREIVQKYAVFIPPAQPALQSGSTPPAP